MEGERLGRIVAVTLLALLVPMACAALGTGTPSASGLPSLTGGAPPAAPSGGDVEAPTDETFLKDVRTTALWTISAGQRAQRQAGSNAVKELGRGLAEDFAELGDEATALAADLGITLPARANEEQRGWLDELAAKSGADFDKFFAGRARGALGALFLTAAHTRAGTWQADVLAFASHVNDVVDRQMTDLESTGLVTDDAPEPARPGSTDEPALGPATSIPEVSPVASMTTESGVSAGLIVLICVAEAGLTAGLVVFLRSR